MSHGLSTVRMPDPQNTRILVIDDEKDVTDLVVYTLRGKNFAVEAVNEPALAIGTARQFAPALVILDVMMPEISGVQIVKLLRADPQLKDTPVIFLTAKGELEDRILGLELGAEDYITKPFSTKELALRVSAILKRSQQSRGGDAKCLQAGGILLDVGKHAVTVAGAPVELTATEFKLLHLLLERRGRVQTREHLLTNVWNYQAEIETRTVDTHVRRLREKLGSEADWIETIRGVGYRFSDRKTAP